MPAQVQTHPLPGVQTRVGSGLYGVFDHGAHVWAWQPDGQRPVLWTSSRSFYEVGRAVRGGIPIIFPWFGGGSTGNLKPAHGYVRTVPWQCIGVRDTTESDGVLTVSYQLSEADTGTQPNFPFRYHARLDVVFAPEYLNVSLTVRNDDTVSVTFEEALHTYLAVSDVRTVRVTGLDGARYLDKVQHDTDFARTQAGELTFTGETDRVYQHAGAVDLVDAQWQRTVHITTDGAADVVVWNPWTDKAAAMADMGDGEWTGMVCVEAVNAYDDAVTLAPGASHLMRQRLSLA